VFVRLDEQTFTGSASNLAFQLGVRLPQLPPLTLGVTVTRDTRIDLPFATAGTYTSVGLSQSGGPLAGTGNFQKIDLEGVGTRRWAARRKGGGSAAQVRDGLSTRSGFVFGNSPFFDQLFTLGGTQFGIRCAATTSSRSRPKATTPMRRAAGRRAQRVGKAFFTLTGEVGLRLSQMFYVSTFYDAGNVWARAASTIPPRLFRGAGVGVVGDFGRSDRWGSITPTASTRRICWAGPSRAGNFTSRSATSF